MNYHPDCCTIPPSSGVTCISWSPKGKQLVAGKSDGTLTQYKPDLKEAKSIPGAGAGSSVLSILWISTYQGRDTLTNIMKILTKIITNFLSKTYNKKIQEI